jgi:hypothetical protein
MEVGMGDPVIKTCTTWCKKCGMLILENQIILKKKPRDIGGAMRNCYACAAKLWDKEQRQKLLNSRIKRVPKGSLSL